MSNYLKISLGSIVAAVGVAYMYPIDKDSYEKLVKNTDVVYNRAPEDKIYNKQELEAETLKRGASIWDWEKVRKQTDARRKKLADEYARRQYERVLIEQERERLIQIGLVEEQKKKDEEKRLIELGKQKDNELKNKSS